MEFVRPTSVDEAVAALADYGEDALPIAGATCAMLGLAPRDARPSALISLDGLRAELSGVSSEGGGVRVGALARVEDLARNEGSHGDTTLGMAAAHLGGWQTRVVATLGGNLCNAAPTAELVPALLLRDAVLRLKSRDSGERSLALDAFLRGPGETARASDELLLDVSFDAAPAGAAARYVKVGRRGAMEVALVGFAIALVPGEGGEIRDARLAVSGITPTARRFPETERMLLGRPSEADLREAGEALARGADPLDDTWASRGYRRAVASRLLVSNARELIREVAAA